MLAAIVAVFAYDRDDEINTVIKDMPPRLHSSLRKINLALRPLIQRMRTAGFETAKFYSSPGVAMYLWSQGRAWDEVIKLTGIAEGDMATLVLRTADNLRQISSLKDTHPDSRCLRAKSQGIDIKGTGVVFIGIIGRRLRAED